MSIPDRDAQAISLDEASRQLELAVHDAQVAYDCIALGHLDRAHTNAITARAAVDAAETSFSARCSARPRRSATRDLTLVPVSAVSLWSPVTLLAYWVMRRW